MSRTMRGVVCPRTRRRGGDGSAEREAYHRDGVREGMGDAASAGEGEREKRRRDRGGPGWAFRRRHSAAQGMGRDGLRAAREHRRAPPLRHSVLQARQIAHRSPPCDPGGGGHPLRDGVRSRQRPLRRMACGEERRCGRRDRHACRPRPQDSRARTWRRPSRA